MSTTNTSMAVENGATRSKNSSPTTWYPVEYRVASQTPRPNHTPTQFKIVLFYKKLYSNCPMHPLHEYLLPVGRNNIYFALESLFQFH